MSYQVSKFSDEYLHLTPSEIYELDTELARSEGVTVDGNLPYYHKGNKHGVMLIHGFAGSPHQMMPLANLLVDSGYTVYVPRVSGHGVDVEHMTTKTAYDWYNDLIYAYSALKLDCDTITVIGQSNGGLLATAVALNNDVTALGLLAPAFKVGSPFFPLVKYAKDYDIKLFVPLTKELQQYNYNYYPSIAMYQLYELAGYVNERTTMIDVPVYLGVAVMDTMISPTIAKQVVAGMSSTDKTVNVYNNIEYSILHILTEPYMKRPMGDVLDWIKRITK